MVIAKVQPLSMVIYLKAFFTCLCGLSPKVSKPFEDAHSRGVLTFEGFAHLRQIVGEQQSADRVQNHPPLAA
jgi:exosome complex RNA-binding protein Rrp42 (RNase PH superfamily)